MCAFCAMYRHNYLANIYLCETTLHKVNNNYGGSILNFIFSVVKLER